MSCNKRINPFSDLNTTVNHRIKDNDENSKYFGQYINADASGYDQILIYFYASGVILKKFSKTILPDHTILDFSQDSLGLLKCSVPANEMSDNVNHGSTLIAYFKGFVGAEQTQTFGETVGDFHKTPTEINQENG